MRTPEEIARELVGEGTDITHRTLLKLAIEIAATAQREAREAALEEAAKACEHRAASPGLSDFQAAREVYNASAIDCAINIRALKETPRE